MLDKDFVAKYNVEGDAQSMGAVRNRRLWVITLTVANRTWIVDDYETGIDETEIDIPFTVYHLSSSANVGGMTFAEVLDEFGGGDDEHRPAQHAMWISGKRSRQDAARWCGGPNTQMYRDFLTVEQSY